MKYNKLQDTIIQSLRLDVNTNILHTISSNNDEITKEQIYNFFTGKGGLHGLKYADYDNYSNYSSAKKELEIGQFFTDYASAADIINIVSPNGTVLDPCCGHGSFCNFIPEHNFYGCELDEDNVKVATYLFPNANISKYDVRYFAPKEKVDFIITNPPFNLYWDTTEFDRIRSQSFILRKSKDWLKDYGIFAAIVPDSFLSDEMLYKQDIQFINSNYAWLGQMKLDTNAFSSYDIDIKMKIIFFQNYPTIYPTFNNDYLPYSVILANVDAAKTLKKKNAVKNFDASSFDEEFAFKVKKFLYEIKRQKATEKNIEKAISLINKFNTQKRPEGMDYDVWEKKHKLQPGTVLYHLKQYSTTQHRKPRRTLDRKPACDLQTTPFSKLGQQEDIKIFLDGFTFKKKDKTYQLDNIQKHDLNLIFQKKYAILNWEQGIGKTVGAYALSKYRNRRTLIVAPANAINQTWIPFLKSNGIDFTTVKNTKDFLPAQSDAKHFYLFSMPTIARDKRLAKYIKRMLRTISNNVQLIVDESDEMSNNNSMLSKNVRIAFIKCRYKLAMTGTTIRNNAAELFPQLQLLYNNSMNIQDKCRLTYDQNKKEKKLDELLNSNIGKPIDTITKFKRCFSPGKCTVFGIEKQKQTVYNYPELIEILGYTQITRTFKEVCGDKYKITHTLLTPTYEEKALQDKILKDFYQMVHRYFEDTGNSKKESGLKLIRQIKLLIKSCSVPQLFAEYKGIGSTKAAKIKQVLAERDELIMIGTTTKDAAAYYSNVVIASGRQLFYIDGTVPFKKREKIIEEFQASKNGVLVSTQQSLSSSVNIPHCNLVIIESLQWNLARTAQYYFRSIRYDSPESTEVMFITYSPSIEDNLMNLMLNKEKIAKALKFQERDTDEVLEELGIDGSILLHLMERKKDTETGKYILQFQD